MAKNKVSTVTLGWFPRDREARVISAIKQRKENLDLLVLERNFDLNLKRGGERFAVPGLQEMARWGHLESGDFPWEVPGLL